MDYRKWALENDVTLVWEDDWEVGSHRDFYGVGSIYEDNEPATCEQVTVYDAAGNVLANLSCVDDAGHDNYRAEVELEVLEEGYDYLADVENRALDRDGPGSRKET